MAKSTDIETLDALKALGYTEKELDRQFREAAKRGKETEKYEPRAVSASYEKGEVVVQLASGWAFTFDPKRYKEFKNASVAELSDVQPWGQGYTLEWPKLDQHFGVGHILFDLIGPKYLASELAARNGSLKSEKKATTSRVNGKLGGRPKSENRAHAQKKIRR